MSVTSSLWTAALAAGLAVWLGWGPRPGTGRLAVAPAVVQARRRGAFSRTTCWAMGAGVGVVAVFVSGWWVAGALAVPVAWAADRFLPADDGPRRHELLARAPTALSLVGACLGAGLPLRSAVSVVATSVPGEISRFLSGIDAAVRVGTDEADAWRALARDPVLGPVAADIARSVGSGTALVGALERHAAQARAQRRAAVIERARTVGVRSVGPLMCCFLPAFLLVGVVPIVASVVMRLLE